MAGERGLIKEATRNGAPLFAQCRRAVWALSRKVERPLGSAVGGVGIEAQRTFAAGPEAEHHPVSGRDAVMPAPTRSTIPEPSWPSTAGQAGRGKSRQLTSVWHSPTVTIRTSTSSTRECSTRRVRSSKFWFAPVATAALTSIETSSICHRHPSDLSTTTLKPRPLVLAIWRIAAVGRIIVVLAAGDFCERRYAAL